MGFAFEIEKLVSRIENLLSTFFSSPWLHSIPNLNYVYTLLNERVSERERDIQHRAAYNNRRRLLFNGTEKKNLSYITPRTCFCSLENHCWESNYNIVVIGIFFAATTIANYGECERENKKEEGKNRAKLEFMMWGINNEANSSTTMMMMMMICVCSLQVELRYAVEFLIFMECV